MDRRRDRANITVQYTSGVPRYGTVFCKQRPLGGRVNKPFRKQRVVRYFHHRVEPTESSSIDTFAIVDDRLEQLNTAVREQPHAFDSWRDLVDYQYYLYKPNGRQDKLTAMYNKQFAIVDRALDLNANRLQYRLLKLLIRTESHLVDHEILFNEWMALIKDCLKSSDDRAINDAWLAYVQFLTNRIELFSIEKLTDAFLQYFSTYTYHMQTRSDKERRFLSNQMIGRETCSRVTTTRSCT